MGNGCKILVLEGARVKQEGIVLYPAYEDWAHAKEALAHVLRRSFLRMDGAQNRGQGVFRKGTSPAARVPVYKANLAGIPCMFAQKLCKPLRPCANLVLGSKDAGNCGHSLSCPFRVKIEAQCCLEGCVAELVAAQGAQERVLAKPCHKIVFSDNEPCLGAAQKLVPGKEHKVASLCHRLLYRGLSGKACRNKVRERA